MRGEGGEREVWRERRGQKVIQAKLSRPSAQCCPYAFESSGKWLILMLVVTKPERLRIVVLKPKACLNDHFTCQHIRLPHHNIARETGTAQ